VYLYHGVIDAISIEQTDINCVPIFKNINNTKTKGTVFILIEALAKTIAQKMIFMIEHSKMDKDKKFMAFLLYVPFVVITLSEYQVDAIKIFRRNNKNKELIFNADATGGVARNPKHTGNCLYYYLIHMPFKPENLTQAA
jgi:hypothetical protein